jgi:hypothetical protein
LSMRKLRSRVSEKWLDENDILRIKYIDGATVDVPAIMESRTENAQLLGNKKELVLCDARVAFTVTPDAQKYALKEIVNKARIATAVITNKSYVLILVNFALRFLKLRSSVKVFRKEEEALRWLYSFKEN